jgi:membrane peptidoglycan carboxypeptidase
MLSAFRYVVRASEAVVSIPVAVASFLTDKLIFNPRLGPLRYLTAAAVGYVAFALLLVYVVAPIRGIAGAYYMGEKLHYDAERWVATAIYDLKGNFVGTFDPRLDSRRDVNYTGEAIEMGSYTANPDHKSIPVREVPAHYWQCLVYHEDRYLGGPLNPFGIDLMGVLKIPYSTVKRSIALKRPSLGVGGSTLPMQFARVIYNTPPSASEGGGTKLYRKLSEWWLAPVIHRVLTQGGDDTPLQQWAANHLWLAQRTGGSSLHGVEMASRIVFGKEAKDLSVAEQYVLASAVNKPIMLLPGSDKLNEVRLDRWRSIAEVRAKTCAERLIKDEAVKKDVVFELVQLAGGPPDPKVKPKLQQALETYAPTLAARAQANPEIRANALLPSARFGLREEMKQAYGFGWRDYVRGLTTTFDIADNLAYGEKVKSALQKLDGALAGKLDPGWTLDPVKVASGAGKSPHVVLVAANAKGEIVRYFEAGETAPYFGSAAARDGRSGLYDQARESRRVASTGKILAAIAIANAVRDTTETLYTDTDAPARGLDTCEKGGGHTGQRKAIVAFACSLNNPLLNRTAHAGQDNVRRLIDGFGFVMPPANANGEGTPPSTAVVLGQVAGAPRRVHQLSGAVLNALIGRGHLTVKPPTLIHAYDYTVREDAEPLARAAATGVQPNALITRGGHALIRALLQAPLCYQLNGQPMGTLKALSHWCAARRGDMRLHFAKTGTQVTMDPNATVDAWITGGLQFANGAAYSYVLLVGTGAEPWARSVHGAQVTPLLEVLLQDLAAHAKQNPRPDLLPPKPVGPVAQAAPSGPIRPAAGAKPLSSAERARVFGGN